MTIRQAFEEHIVVANASIALLPEVEKSAVAIRKSLNAGGKVLACGNGGSAADAQHFVAEFVGRYQRDRKALPALSLTTDTSILTSVANDFSYDNVFARQIEALAQPNDVLVALSTSGNSANVIAAAKAAKARSLVVIAFTGKDGGRLREFADILIAVPSTVVARVQEVHELALHAIAESIDEGVKP